ncbi:ADP-ribosyl cyclase/cyclic ADP-ribose hydrolase [Citrus sinensis]|nr:ADP-ribosyl cyclase/cyclic ADP-ribose hydrolase [Citrus sinensis]
MASCKYDVFLSFKGEDTRDNFLSHLVVVFQQKKIKTFVDEELTRGDEISPALLKAIEESKISVIIFSKNYASSKWCLDELVKILQCHKKNGQLVIPVFYNVDPSDVRNQTGSFKDAFVKHDKQFNKKMPEKVQKWRAVLTEASNLSGWDSGTTKSQLGLMCSSLAANSPLARPDAKLVKEITADILEKLEKLSAAISDSDGLIGLESRVEQVKSLLAIGLPDVRLVGIWGMGGIGKTTIAGVVFNQFSQKFEGKYFMANVREESEKCGGLVHLRNQVLSKVLGENFDIGTPKIPQYIRDRLQRMKVFIVLDDVSKYGQLEYFAGGLDRFGPGSRIIVTTRDKTILERYGTHRIYEVEGLNCNEAFQLFCSCAFKENHCPEDLLKHSETAVHYAKGNPLALKVLGSSFHGKSKPDWVNTLNNLKRISGSDIYGVLKISYDELSWEEKNLFLDIACFFNGDDREHVMWILSDDYYSVQYGMNVLINKSLIKISYNKLQMHDLLQEMGREIVCQEFREKPEKRSRLWDYKDVCHVLEKNKGTDAIKSIFLDLSKIEEINLDPRVFSNMSNLRLLKFYISGHFDISKMSSKVHLQQGLENLPEELRYLYWHGYPLKTLPLDFVPQNLIELNFPYSKVEQIWEGKKKAPKLKYVDLNHSTNLTRIPEPSETPNLERINFWNCTGLAHIPSYVQNFNKLGNMIMAGCESLRCFPQNIHFISSIKIDCYKCVNLREFPRISGNVVELNLMCTPIEEVPLSIECLPNLETLEMSFCNSLKRLSTSICKLKSLRSLDLSYCINLESFPEILEKMELLEEINLEEASNIKELPSSIENLEGLKQLKLTGCTKLGSLPESLGNLKSLERLHAGLLAIPQAPSSIVDLNKLETLSLFECRGLVLPPLLSGLSSLKKLELGDCEIMEIPPDIGCLSSLESLNLSGNNIESLPTSISQLSRLRWLCLVNCVKLQSLPELPLLLVMLGASDCKRLQFLPELTACLEELDVSILQALSNRTGERLSKHMSPVQLIFANCLKLNESTWADLQKRIRHMIIASLRLFYEKEFDGISFCLPGSEVPDWYSSQSIGSLITIQLPHRCGSKIFIGFALCVAIEFEFEEDSYSPAIFFGVGSVSFDFFIRYQLVIGKGPQKVKCCGVSPVYANLNTFTLEFGGSSEDFHDIDNAQSVGGSHEKFKYDFRTQSGESESEYGDRQPVAAKLGATGTCRTKLGLMDSVVLELCYDGWWETLENGCMEYVNGKNRAFLVGKNYLFDQLLARVYEVLKINPNDYSITMKTTLRSSNTLYRICAMPMDICDDEMVRVVLHMASNVANFGCIPIFVTTSPRVPSEGIEPHVDTETSFRANMSGPDNDEEVLPRTISLQQYYSPIHDNYDNIDDNGVTLQDVGATVFPITTSLEQQYSPYHNNDFRDNDDFHNETEGDNIYAEPSNNTRRGTRFNNDGDDGGAGPSNVPSFQDEDECEDNTPVNNRGNRPIPSMVRSRRRIDPLTSLAPTLPSNMVAPSFVSSCDSDDISVGKLFAEKNELILQLRKAYRAREVGLEIVRGNPAESYNLLPKYSHVLTTANEGTVTHLEQDGDGNFLYYFVALGSSIKGFMQYIRPVIAVDGTHLKGLYRGSMFVATCLDGNNQLYPLAIGIMDSENNDAWEWFMMKLHGVIGDRPELVIISDRCTAIRRAVLKVFHNATHGVCFYHVKGNIKSQFRMSKALWDEFEPTFINAAKAYGHEEFKRQLEGLWMIHSGAADYLENNVGMCNWARSQFQGRRYNILTTNIAESVNAFMREPRKFPVTHLVDHFRKILQQWFYDRKIVAESMTTRLTTWADEIVTERRTIADRMIVRPVSPHRFQVIGGGLKEGLVDLQKRTCSCRVFHLDQLVCAHAIAACLTHRVDFINLCSDFYTTESLAMAYAQPVEPVGDVADWEVPDEIQELQEYPPVEAPPPGRRKERRIPSAGEDVDRRTVRCGRCHELGHNRKRCKNPIASTRS